MRDWDSRLDVRSNVPLTLSLRLPTFKFFEVPFVSYIEAGRQAPTLDKGKPLTDPSIDVGRSRGCVDTFYQGKEIVTTTALAFPVYSPIFFHSLSSGSLLIWCRWTTIDPHLSCNLISKIDLL